MGDVGFYAEVGLTGNTPIGITGANYREVIINGMDPQLTLYPKCGYYISKSGINEFFGDSKTLSAGDVIYIDYQKTFMIEERFVYYALLKLSVIRVIGTADSITINVYVATGEVNEYTGWSAVQSGGALRGNLLGSNTIYLTDDNENVYVDICDFIEEHIYGNTGYTGIIIEAIPNNGTAEVKIAGLYCWDNDAGEVQNPIIQIYYGYTPTSYPKILRINRMVSDDAYISSYDATDNFNSQDIIIEVEDGIYEKRGLFKFDLSDIPAGSDILKAILYLPRSAISKVNGIRGGIYTILQDWDEESVSWLYAEEGVEWHTPGGYYDDSGHYDSYNMIVGKRNNAYDITKLLQVMFGSFEYKERINGYGFMFKGQDITFDSNGINDVAYIDVIYMAAKLNQPPESPTPTEPVNGTVTDDTPEFVAIINDDNFYGSTEGDDLHFRIEISNDISFSSNNIISFSTVTSTLGWHWSALGDFSDDSTDFPITAGSYTPGVSKVKFNMSEAGASLSEGHTWMWRIIAIDE